MRCYLNNYFIQFAAANYNYTFDEIIAERMKTNMGQILAAVTALILVLVPLKSEAYIGPGMGISMAATILGLFVAFILLVVGLIWLPIRRFFRYRKLKQESNINNADSNNLEK